MKKNKCIQISALLLITTITLAGLLLGKTSALSGSSFKPGKIIDDAVFYDSYSMNASQIQQFLNAKVPVCDTNGTKPYGGTTRALYGSSKGYPPPYTCIKDFAMNVPAVINSGSDLCKESINGGSKTAAQIIQDVARACAINPQVLIVLLQKEQSLITDDWPWSIQYRSATGYGCPDTAACDSQYYGFFNQVYQAAQAFRRYEANPTSYNYRAGRNNFIYYHPSLGACGGTNVFIENQATANLYIYTPYQPNIAALNNLYGTGDSCSAYGNRNFWRMFNDWFGDPIGNKFIPMEEPRFMRIKENGTYKKNIFTGQNAGSTLESGKQIKFVDKIYFNGSWYLRTEWNRNNGDSLYGILLSEVEEIPYEPISPLWLTMNQNGHRSRPSTQISLGGTLIRGTSVRVVDKIIVNGNKYYRTEFNRNNKQDAGIHERFLSSFEPIPLDNPRRFCSNNQIDIINPQNQSIIESIVSSSVMISKKTLINGTWYFQRDTDIDTLNFINSTLLREMCYVPLNTPRSFRFNIDTPRFNPYSDQIYDTIPRGAVVHFDTKIYFNNQWYYRTSNNTLNNIDAVVPAIVLSEAY